MIDNKTKVFIVVGLILIGIIIYLLRREPVHTIDKVAIEEARYYKDINGKLVAMIKQKDISESNMKQLADSLAKALKVKPKYIKGIDTYNSTIEIEYRDTSSTVLIGKDTAYKIEKHDPYVDIIAIAGKDSGSISLKMRDTLTRVEKVKNPLIGRTTREVLLRNASPYTTIQSGYSYTIKEKKVILGVGPYVGIDFRGQPSFGISIQFPIIQIKR